MRPAQQLVSPDQLRKTLVITCVSNPILYESRYRLYRDFEKYMKDSGATLLTAEIATGNRAYGVTTKENPAHFQFRSVDDFWHKENMQNETVRRASATNEYMDWENVLFIDADVFFFDPHWLSNTWQLLQRYEVVQMFSQAQDLTPSYTMFQKHRGFVASYIESGYKQPTSKAYESWHPGFAWGMTRNAYRTLGGLIDFSFGAGDRQMALAYIGGMVDGDQSIPVGISKGYRDKLMHWQERAALLKRDIGYLPGTVGHMYHGRKVNRFYKSRPQIWIGNQYDPNTDLKRDEQGLWQIVDDTPRQIKLRDEMRAYFAARNEDDISVG